jgi:hypothetical protein
MRSVVNMVRCRPQINTDSPRGATKNYSANKSPFNPTIMLARNSRVRFPKLITVLCRRAAQYCLNKIVSTKRKFTPFEQEIMDIIAWLLRGLETKAVSLRATNRILRASLRRIQPITIGRSLQATEEGESDLDHAIPLSEIVSIIHKEKISSKNDIEDLLNRFLINVKITRHEHTVVLPQLRLSRSMPSDWDKIDLLARYKKAGIGIMPN